MELHACYFKDLGGCSTDQRRASATAGKPGTRATGQRNWPTHPAVPPGTDDQNSTPARELEPPQPLLRSLNGGQHPCAKIGVSAHLSGGRAESHRPAPTDPGVTISRHRALVILITRQTGRKEPIPSARTGAGLA